MRTRIWGFIMMIGFLLLVRPAGAQETPMDRWLRFQDVLPVAKEDPQLWLLADLLSHDTDELDSFFEGVSNASQSRAFDLVIAQPSDGNESGARMWQVLYDLKRGTPDSFHVDAAMVNRWDYRLAAFEEAVSDRRMQVKARKEPEVFMLGLLLNRVSRLRLELNLGDVLLRMAKQPTASGKFLVNWEAVPTVVEISRAYGIHVPERLRLLSDNPFSAPMEPSARK